MSEPRDDCVHGTPLTERCEGFCEHGKRCGEKCEGCSSDYIHFLGEMCDLAGGGDREKGRQVLLRMLAKADGANQC